MPFSGLLDVVRALGSCPQLKSLPEDAWNLPGAEILQFSCEVEEEGAIELIPPALHPSIPPYAVISVAKYPVSPVGPFSLAQVRLVARAGIRPRAFLLQAFIDSEQAAAPLSEHWGFKIETATVDLAHRHDLSQGTVSIENSTVLDIRLENAHVLSGEELNIIDGLHLTRSEIADDGEGLILQVDPEYVFSYAERGEPDLAEWNPEGFDSIERLVPVYPIVSIYARCDQDLPVLRFGMDPNKEGARGAVRCGAAT